MLTLRIGSRKRIESSVVVVTIPDRVKEELIHEKIPKGDKEARLADICKESISRRFHSGDILSVLVEIKEAR